MELTQKRIIRSKIAFIFVVFGKYNNKIALFCPKSCEFLAYLEKKQHSGVANAGVAEQLEKFRLSLLNAGVKRVPKLKSWSLAFFHLGQYLAALPQGKKIVFIDEMPWMDILLKTIYLRCYWQRK